MADAYIIDACRTPRGIGKVGKGALAHLHPQHLGATVLKAIAVQERVNGFKLNMCQSCFDKRSLSKRVGMDKFFKIGHQLGNLMWRRRNEVRFAGT